MTQRAHSRSQREREAEPPPLTAREAVDLVRELLTEITGAETVRITSVAPSEDGGWIVEVETVEDRRIPSSADILALYEMELDYNGELLGYRRIRRYMRGQTANGGGLE
jgi:hypothetical protein